MNQVNSTQLALHLGCSKARVSQYVSEGKLEGCYEGEGRARRFDLVAVARQLGRTLDAGQMLGNGAATKKAINALMLPSRDPEASEDLKPAALRPGGGATELPAQDPDRYELARTMKVEQEARRLLRQNELEDGTLVLASEAARQTARLIGQEIAEVEQMIRDAARRIADRLGVDYRVARQIMVDCWREHRASRASALVDAAGTADLTADELAADI